MIEPYALAGLGFMLAATAARTDLADSKFWLIRNSPLRTAHPEPGNDQARSGDPSQDGARAGAPKSTT
jgi:hypothetical protein